MPNSLLWIGLVVLWIFVLFPMFADRHPRIRRTTDAALATRVLHRGGSKRKAARGPAAGHDSDPNWRPRSKPERPRWLLKRAAQQEDAGNLVGGEDPVDTETDSVETTVASEDSATDGRADARPEESGPPATPQAAPDDDRDELPADFAPVRRGRGGFDPQADAIARAARYSFRQRAVLGLLLGVILSGALGMVINSKFWWVCAGIGFVLVTYLCYLRRQVRMEEEIRRRRMARLARSRRAAAQEYDQFEEESAPRRSRGVVALDIDDEDPAFDHLDYYGGMHARRVSPQAMRRAAGE
ncbi:hypothetical protein FOS14_10585 [Skermania sp. ID1734]|uniref:divisome protein SepX/GlpR n=1 Tax=Skermania sp. ID1734 TaxID=2597516 RepID=UPI00117C7498|nr:gephyrin-like molybdotransferase receptor GlpR [Skermania sp. ID1734]TSD99710.1 hypothetical protein FOS14_10585 [Skermania sp. ID1734]